MKKSIPEFIILKLIFTRRREIKTSKTFIISNSYDTNKCLALLVKGHNPLEIESFLVGP